MDGRDINNLIGLTVIAVGFVAWLYVYIRDPHRQVRAAFFLLLSLGMMAVSTNALLREVWIAGVIAAANRIIVTGLGIREAWIIHTDARAARREP